MTTYRISQLAERSGVPATTLRFYETAGLLPAERTASGYRVYGEGAVDRLAFISSAKLLGLALEEIRGLLDVREDGACASVRARMRPLVTERIREAEGRIAELHAFVAHLASVRAALSGLAPEGACGPDCGCTTARATVTGPEREAWRDAPVSCTLGGAELGERTERWRALVATAVRREETEDGVRLFFPPRAEIAARLAGLAAAEQDCCAFFDFTLHLTPAALELSVRAPAGGAGVLAELFGGGARPSSPGCR
ncbi:MerR family transcriptional regulator [Streptomyces sp. NPDC057798]|uniref:MerR family transcriptional regulator n=1 Tax=Streptomyces sp. NPDC057798 TaxID=3346252 RepID=UPI0036781B2D